MESVQAQSMQITDTKPLCSSPSNTENGVEEISKQLENELLYGGTDDGDALSDDALSEDSYRLRVSDDENLEEKVDTSKIVENREKNLVHKTELKASTSEVLTTNGDTIQLDKINSSSKVCEREKNSETNVTEDYVLEQDNCCEDKIKLDSNTCTQLKPAEVDSSSSETGKIILVNSQKPLSDIDSDSNEYHHCDDPEKKNNDIEQIESNDSPKVLPTSKGDSLIKKQEAQHNSEDSSKTDSSSSNVIDDKHNNEVEKQLDNCGNISTPDDKTEDIILENGIEDNKNKKRISEPVNDVSNKEQNDVKDDCQIVNSADNEPLTEESSNSGDIDEHSKEESSKIDDVSSVNDKSSKIMNFPPTLESSEVVSDIKSENIEEHKDSSSVKTSDEVLGSGKRRLSSSENTIPKKLQCVEPSPQETNKAGSAADTIEIIDEADETPEKPTVTNHILKTLLADAKNAKADDEIIDVDDDNTIDSMSSGISLSANDSLTNSDSTNSKTKQDSEIKETPGEKVNLDNSKTRKTQQVRGDQLVPGKDIVTRTKREAAQKAEETVRKNIVTLNNNSDSESSDSNNMVPYTPKPRAPSPASLKRNHTDDNDERVDPSTVKKLKTEIENENTPTKTKPLKTESKKTFESVRKFFLRDSKDKLKKITQEELEELFIQKIIETITMREEIGKLREKAKISEKNLEATRMKCQQMSKQINDFDMVLNRFSADRRNNPNGNANPIKINRSVGLQVNFLTDHGVQNLRQLQSAGKSIQQKILAKSPLNGSTPPHNDDVNARRGGIKVRSPRRTDGAVTPVSATSQNSFQVQPLISTMTPSSIALSKPVNTYTTASTGQTIHHVVVNGITNSITRTTKVISPNNKSNTKLIDLTDEEEKKNSVPPPLTAIITTNANSTNVPKVQTRYQRVIPATNSVNIPQSSIRVVQPAGQPTPTALVNNMNNMSNIGGPQRFVVMQPARQLVIAPNGNQIRATTGNNRGLSNITYASVPTMPNGTVRVVPTSGTTVQLYKVTHPAPLPDVATYPASASLKLPPPAPSLKISKVAHGIVLSWNMSISDKYADIASYQLYAYQEISGMAPASSNWKKVGDVRALPLPMACTLTQFSEGNNYYFAVRAVDTHSRYGQYSQPGNISL